jgi:NTE family protein
VFRPVKKDDMVLVDGGVKCRVPISQARHLGADVVVAVDALGPLRPQNKDYNIISVMLRSFDIMDDEISRYRHDELQADLYLAPDLGDMSQFRFTGIEKAIDVGYKLGLANIEKIKELLK